MEILNKNAALLSNSEVYALLKHIKHEQTQKLIKKKNLDVNNVNLDKLAVDKHLPTIVYESLRYLEKTACKNQSSLVVSDFLRKLDEKKSDFQLTKVEKLLILNHCPSSAVELQCLIEDSEERFSVEQMDSLLELIQTSLPIHCPADQATTSHDQEDASSNNNHNNHHEQNL
jgi:hypothetical protein